jgi:uncharacterized protein
VTDEPTAPHAEDHPLRLLLAVQDLDTAITQHEHRKASLPERRELQAVATRQAELGRRRADLESQRAELQAHQAHIEEQSRAVVARRTALEERLYAARGAAGRDLQAIESEVSQLAARLSQLEDDELALMVDQEPVDAELGSLTNALEELNRTGAGLSDRIGAIDTEIDAKLTDLVAARSQAAARLPEALGRRYESLRTRLDGVGAARLVGNRCDGCHLELPAVEIDRIRHLPPDEMVTCDQCGRILVRADAAGPA